MIIRAAEVGRLGGINTFTMTKVALASGSLLDIPGGNAVGTMVEPSPILNLASTFCFLHGAEPKWPSPSPVQPIQREETIIPNVT